jgi:hypothetical protein
MKGLLSLVGGEWGSNQDESKFPQEHFIHFYAHQFKYIKDASMFHSVIIRTVFRQHISILSLFSVSVKRRDLLTTLCGRTVPKPVKTRRTFQSRVINSAYINKDSQLIRFDIIQN